VEEHTHVAQVNIISKTSFLFAFLVHFSNLLSHSYEITNNTTVKPVYHGLTNNYCKIFKSLKKYHCDVASSRIIASIIQTLLNEEQQQISVEETLSLTEAVILFFYSCLECDYGKDCFTESRRNVMIVNICTTCVAFFR
jgi:hypothetical protein